LTQETVGLSSTASWTNVFAYDKGVAGGPGVLTGNGQAAGTNVVWKGGTDAFSRVNAATNSVAQRQAYGLLNGPATMTALLDGNPMGVTTVGTNDVYEWRAQLALQPGAHQLIVNALNWSGYYTASATNTFTNHAADRVLNSYAGNGEVTSRAWISANGQTNATQSLSWDAKDRLHGVTYVDSNTNGYIWSAIYDGFGRRLATTTIFITNGVTVSSLPKTISQSFDPNVQFLELGETDSGGTTWKFYGPDLNGVYGGMQGVGGLDAVVNGPRQSSPVVSDIRGNGYAIFNLAQGSLVWYSSRVTAYGAVEGYRPLPLADGAKMAAASAWRGKWADITGLYWLGHRYYDPTAGDWLGADPLGHDADPSLYAFCAASDPVNSFDPDGRLATATANYAYNGGAAGYALRELAGVYNQFGAASDNSYFSWSAYNGGSLLNLAAGAVTPSSYVNSYNTLQDRAEGVMTGEYLNGSGGTWTAAQGLSSLVGDMVGYNNAYESGFGVDRQTQTMLDNVDRTSRGFMAVSQLASTTATLGATYVPPATPAVGEGIVYKRTNPTTGEDYIGQSQSPERFEARQGEHDAGLGVEHEYEVMGNAEPGTPLDVLEESQIRANGGLQREGGTLANRRHQMNDARYRQAGGTVPDPNH
jgi:RHS repeat-associated protein